MAEREDKSHEDKESRDQEGTASDGESRDDERDSTEDEPSGEESSGREGSGAGDADHDADPDEGDSTDDHAGDDNGSAGSRRPRDDERTAPAYSFSGEESSGDEAPASASGGDADEAKSKAPVTAATTQWHPSRGDQKKARRLENEEREAQDEKRARRKHGLKRAAWGVGGALLIILIAVLISTQGGEKAETGGSDVKGPAVGATAVKARFEGIEQDGLALGDPEAPVTLAKFGDLQCPACRDASNNTLPALVDRYVKEGKLRIEFRNYPIRGPESDKAARALEGAADQNKAWQFIDLWYLNQGEENSGYVTDDFIRKIAKGAGLDADAVVEASNDMDDAKTTAVANKEAQEFGVQEIPSYLIGRTGEEPTQLQIQDPTNPELFAQAIDRIINQQE